VHNCSMRCTRISLVVLVLGAALHENDAFFLGKRARRQQQQPDDDDSKRKAQPHHYRNRWFKWSKLLNAQHERVFLGVLFVQQHIGVRGMLAAARTAAVNYGECYKYTYMHMVSANSEHIAALHRCVVTLLC
jgi:hypothetical protein